MIDDVVKDLQSAIAKAHDALKRDLAKLRTGRATANMLDGVRVDYYGAATPLNQMANVSVPEPRLIVVKPFDKTQVKAVEKAIRDAQLGLNPQAEADIVRIPIPALNEERRKELVKLAKKNGEECKVAIRNARRDANDFLNEADKEGTAQAEDIERGKKKVEELVAEGTKTVDQIIAHKEKDILEI
jgi:ribosome recycling factor